MGAFAIYAFVVTGLYILYMSAVIMKDLFGKKGQKKDAAEEFNTADIGEDLLQEESEASQAEYERLVAVKKEMLSIKPSYQDEYTNDEYRASTARPLSEQSRILCKMVGNL